MQPNAIYAHQNWLLYVKSQKHSVSFTKTRINYNKM